jgi:Protein of unknown function (DUF1501)
LAGAGICAGQVYGSSDRDGAYPARDAVTAADLTATLFHSIGIDHESTFRDAEGRERRLTLGSPIRPLLGGGVATADRVPAGGNVLAARYDTSLLLNTDFAEPTPLYPARQGSRPKGWRAEPILFRGSDDFGVWADADLGSSISGRCARLGFRAHSTMTRVERGGRAVLAQEMRNPRAGSFTFTVDACVVGPERAAAEWFKRHFACRLVMYRFADSSKNPLGRQEFGSLAIDPPFCAAGSPVHASFEYSRVLDGAAPGQNFSIGKGLGVSIEIEKVSDGAIEWSGQWPDAIALCVRSARLSFASHTIDDKVVV